MLSVQQGSVVMTKGCTALEIAKGIREFYSKDKNKDLERKLNTFKTLAPKSGKSKDSARMHKPHTA